MAIETVPLDNLDTRLKAIQELCIGIASKVHSAQAVLLDDSPSELDVVVSSMLCQLGWMADRAAQLAGGQQPVGGGPEDWMLGPDLQSLLGALK